MSLLRDHKQILDCFQDAVLGSDDPSSAAQRNQNPQTQNQNIPNGASQQKDLLDKDVKELMLADLEQKLLEILQEGKKVMRASKRHVLTTQDITHAMNKLQVPDTYGYPSSTEFSYSQKLQPDAQTVLWYHKPQVVNLRELVVKQNPVHMPLQYSKYMTALDGIQPDIAENVKEIPNFDQTIFQQLSGTQEPEVVTIQPINNEEAAKKQKELEQAELIQQAQNYMTDQQKRLGELSKDLDAFYTMFIQQFQLMEHETKMVGDELLISPQIEELLKQIEKEPFLVNLIPHLVKFIETKTTAILQSSQMVNAEQPIQGDVSILDLLLKILQAIIKNPFYDFDQSLKVVIPILMSLTLAAHFHQDTSIRVILRLKDKTATMLAQLIGKFDQKYELKIGYANFLKQQIIGEHQQQDAQVEEFEKPLVSPLTAYGCLMSLLGFGPHISSQVLLDSLSQIHESLKNQYNKENALSTEQDSKANLSSAMLEVVSKCFKALHQICVETARYLESYQIAGGPEVTEQKRKQVIELLGDVKDMIGSVQIYQPEQIIQAFQQNQQNIHQEQVQEMVVEDQVLEQNGEIQVDKEEKDHEAMEIDQ